MEERVVSLIALIDAYFESERPDTEKRQMANLMLKVLAREIRLSAEHRGIGLDSMPHPYIAMPPATKNLLEAMRMVEQLR